MEDGRERQRTGTESCPARREKHGFSRVLCACVCVCVRVLVWEGERKVERSEEDLGNKRTVSGVCRGAEATHECPRQPLTRTQTRHTYTHALDTLNHTHITASRR